MLLSITIITSLVGCSVNNNPTIPNDDSSDDQEVTTTPNDPTKPSDETSLFDEIDKYNLTDQQRNSFSMLYYLAITAEEIRISKDNRLLLEDIYTSLLNDINPGAIDETTQDHLKNLRDIIKSYINISVKRDRLQYIYNQNKAATIRSAVPNPLAILSMTNALNWKKLATSAVYTVVDSYNNYKTANEAADQEFLMSGWELDDEETAAIQKNRERAFDYMVDIVQEYNLDGKFTLNEKAIETFAKICEIESVQQKIRRLESEKETYKLLGNYWLELADCYYETSQYKKCLDCVGNYKKLSTGIYRNDYNYVKILPKAIVATQEVYDGDAYISNIKAFADDIIKNTTAEEWSTRYFVAQVYLDLYARTNEKKYLEDAYNIAYDNVAILLDEQKKLNDTYLADVKEVTIDEPDYKFMTEEEEKKAKKEYKAEKKRLKAYNKSLKEERETELPPLYEPLVLNCELLFALADKMNISDLEKTEIEAILQTKTNGVFLSKPINRLYSFSKPKFKCKVELEKNEVILPVILLTSESKIVIEVIDNGKTTIFDDCIVSDVEREDDKIESFYVTVTSKKMKDYDWSKNSKVSIKILNSDENNMDMFQFKVAKYSDNWILPDTVEFEKE